MNEKPLNILLIEDTATDAEILQHLLRYSSVRSSSVFWVRSFKEAAKAFSRNKFDVVLTDLGLPDSTGTSTVQRLRELSNNLPIIALTGQDDGGVGQAAIQAGANDYIPKSVLSAAIISRAIVHSMERFQMANRLVEANRLLETKNERLSQMYKMSQHFVDNVSHEFRTPLTVIREFAAILRDGIDGSINEQQHNRLSTLINRTDELSSMVDDLLDTSRLEAGLLRTCREEHILSDIVHRVERMLRTRAGIKKIQVKVLGLPDGLTVFCDEEKLRRVLINLLVNAIKFTPVAGEIEISASMVGVDRVKITVADNGPGIAADELKRIFERFQQVEAHHRMASCKGFGLGLSIARALASLNLGSLKVESVEGHGSQFSVLVPVAKLDSVLNCYFDQRRTTIDANDYVSLIEVFPDTPDSDSTEETLETLDEFLRSSVKSFDLVLRAQDNRWLMFTCGVESSFASLKERMEKEWDKLEMNHFGDSLPKLRIEYRQTISVEAGWQEFGISRLRGSGCTAMSAKLEQQGGLLTGEPEVSSHRADQVVQSKTHRLEPTRSVGPIGNIFAKSNTNLPETFEDSG